MNRIRSSAIIRLRMTRRRSKAPPTLAAYFLTTRNEPLGERDRHGINCLCTVEFLSCVVAKVQSRAAPPLIISGGGVAWSALWSSRNSRLLLQVKPRCGIGAKTPWHVAEVRLQHQLSNDLRVHELEFSKAQGPRGRGRFEVVNATPGGVPLKLPRTNHPDCSP